MTASGSRYERAGGRARAPILCCITAHALTRPCRLSPAVQVLERGAHMRGLAMTGILLVAAASTASCPVEQARYAFRNDSSVTAYFRPVESGPDWPSRIALAVHYRKTGRTFWWLPWNGGSNGLQNVASTEDVRATGWRPPSPDGGSRPFGNRQYIVTDSSYNIIDHVPVRGDPAPRHMLFPDSAGSGDSAFLARQFFDFVGCVGAGE
jgi:hypothetical protein